MSKLQPVKFPHILRVARTEPPRRLSRRERRRLRRAGVLPPGPEFRPSTEDLVLYLVPNEYFPLAAVIGSPERAFLRKVLAYIFGDGSAPPKAWTEPLTDEQVADWGCCELAEAAEMKYDLWESGILDARVDPNDDRRWLFSPHPCIANWEKIAEARS